MRTSRKGQAPSRYLDITYLRELMHDTRFWCALGIVFKPDNETSHFILEDDDLLVDVRLMPNREPLLCRMTGWAGGAGIGLWAIPPVGSEVAVLIPTGNIEETDAIIVGVLSTGQLPDGLTESRVILAVKPGTQILIHDGHSGEARALAYEDHTHEFPATQAGGNPVSTDGADLAGAEPITTGPGSPGTTVLKSK